MYDFFPIRNIDSYLAPTISDCVVYVAAGKQVLTASGSKHTGMLWGFFLGGGVDMTKCTSPVALCPTV